MRHAPPIITLFAIATLATACSGGDEKTEADSGSAAAAAADKGPSAVEQPASWITAEERKPKSLHMTWQRDPATTITFQWTTDNNSLDGYTPRAWVVPASVVDAEGAKGRMPWSSDWVFKGEGVTYETELLGTVILPGVNVIWMVEATGLKPDTEYVYRVGTWQGFDATTARMESPTLSPPRRFRTPPAKGSRAPMHVIMAGDSREGTDLIRKEMKHLKDRKAAVWFFNGDMCSAGLQHEWDDWFDAMAPVLHKHVLMPVQGNHEFYANVYYTQFALPRAAELPPELVEHGWSIDVNNVHFVGLDSNTDKSVKGQVAWLDADLGAARADPDIDWLVVMSHHPMYSAGNHGSTPRMKEYWQSIFDKHEVDLAFSGHDHSYERTVPIRNNKKAEDGKGVTYIVAGGFFAPPYGAGKKWWTVTSTSGDVYNWVDMKVAGKTIEITAWSGDGKTVLDSLTLKR